MRDYLKSCFKYFVFISFFGMCIHLIYLIVPIYMMVICDRVLYSFSTATLMTLSALTLFSLIIMGILDYIRSKMLLQAGFALEQKMLPAVLSTLHNSAIAINTPRYTRGLQDLMLVGEAIAGFKIMRFLDLPWVVIYLALLYFMHPIIGLVATAGLGMIALFQFLLKILNTKRYTASSAAASAASNFLSTTIRNAELITGMGMLTDVTDKYGRADKRMRTDKYAAENHTCTIGGVKATLQGIFTAGLFGTGAYLFFNHEITIGIIFAGVIIMTRLFSPLDLSFGSFKSSIEAVAAYRRLTHRIDLKEGNSTLSLPRPEGKLQAENVILAVQNRTLLRNISFQLEPGETLGIFGPSAAGKTALVRVILGIWLPQAGKMRLDGAEITQWKREDLGKYLGYLPQETEFFQGTVGENIARLKKVDSDKVILAAKKAHCHDMILKLPQGYDFMIDGTGKNLSCGQRQQIALARALYDDPQVIAMDQPQQNLDDIGFKALFTALQILRKEKKSVVIVTDRPNILINTDKLLMLKDGQVAMFGPSREVLAKLTHQQAQTKIQSPQQAQATPGIEQIKQN
ncbi:MAG: ATP-binding cassette domain-containing protein [Desulfobacterales bacterium]|nr:ATP-binding cassette domain-containing protein [Desulfobacterales bacterium]